MIIGDRIQRTSRKAGAAVARSAIAKAVVQLKLAGNSAKLCDPELAEELAGILARLAMLQRALAAAPIVTARDNNGG
jgi:hypothetical protein